MLYQRDFGSWRQFVLENGSLTLSAMELGATVTGLRFKGREILLRFDRAEDYLKQTSYLCAAVGRCANRIGGARFRLNGREYRLPANEGRSQLHGGPEAFDWRRWDAQPLGDSAVRFTLQSPDGDNGFPGALEASVTYSLSGSAFRIEFEGLSDADTVFAPTSHLYFNLAGAGSVLDAELQINGDRYVEVDRELIPTGRLLPAEGDFDFRRLRRIGRDYDHCFALNGGERALLLRAGGIAMELYTDFPGVQIYTGSALEAPFGRNGGLAIEPEFYPDSPNRPEFPSVLLRKGESFRRTAEFRFSEA